MYPKITKTAVEEATQFRSRHEIVTYEENNPNVVVVRHGKMARFKNLTTGGVMEIPDDCRDMPKEARRNLYWWLKLLKMLVIMAIPGLLIYGFLLSNHLVK